MQQLRTLALATCVIPLEQLQMVTSDEAVEDATAAPSLMAVLRQHWCEISTSFPAAALLSVLDSTEQLQKRKELLSISLEAIAACVVRGAASTRRQRAELGTKKSSYPTPIQPPSAPSSSISRETP